MVVRSQGMWVVALVALVVALALVAVWLLLLGDDVASTANQSSHATPQGRGGNQAPAAEVSQRRLDETSGTDAPSMAQSNQDRARPASRPARTREAALHAAHEEDQDASHLETAAVVGRVVSPEGESLADVAVGLVHFARVRRGVPPFVLESDVVSVVTDDQGRFALPVRERLERLHYAVALPAAPYAPVHAAVDVDYVVRPTGELQQPQAPFDVGDLVVAVGVTVEGRVTDREGQPLAGARVAYGGYVTTLELDGVQHQSRQAALETVTDADGRYRLEGATPGEVEIRAEAPRYLSQQQGLETEPGETLAEVDFELPPATALRLRALDEHGAPLAGASATTRAGNEVVSDEDGQADFAWLPKLNVRLTVAKLGYERVRRRLRLVPGRVVTHEVTLSRVSAITLRPVDADTGEPLYGADSDASPGGNLRARAHCGRRWHGLRASGTDEDGTRRFTAPPLGAMTLELWPLSYRRLVIPVSLSASEPLDLGDVAFEAGTRFLVEVRDHLGEPATNHAIHIRAFELGEHDPTSEHRRQATSGMNAYTDEHGQWRSPPLGGARFEFTVMREHRQGRATRSRTVGSHTEVVDGSRDLVHVRIDLDEAAPLARVTGTAWGVDGQPLAQQRINLAREMRGRSRMAYGVNTDDDGRFEFENVASGRYRLTTRPNRNPSDTDDWFELEHGDRIERDFHLTADRFTGTLIWHGGAVASNLNVALVRGDEPPSEGSTDRTDAAGRFALLEPVSESDRYRSPPRGRLRVDVGRDRRINLSVSLASFELGELRLPPLDSGSRGALRVRTVDAHSLEPVAVDVHVSGRIGEELVSRTVEVEGEVVLEDLPVGELRVWTRSGEFAGARPLVEVEPGQTREVVLELTRQYTATFRVTQADEGVAGGGDGRIHVVVRPLQQQRPRRGGRGYHGAQINVTRLLELTEYVATIQSHGYAEQTLHFTATAEAPPTFDVTLQPLATD